MTTPDFHLLDELDLWSSWHDATDLKDRALATPPPEPVAERYQAIARHTIESCLAQREEVLAAFIAKHGFHPEDIIQVEQRQPDGTSTWRIERRAVLAIPPPEPPTVKLKRSGGYQPLAHSSKTISPPQNP
jgi:hypothetical protein